MTNQLQLWGFLQAFQESPYKYLYMRQMIEALEQIQQFTTEDLIAQIIADNPPDTCYWLDQLKTQADKITEEESKFWRPEFKFVFYGEKDFPIRLREISDPPLALSYQGDLSSISNFAVSVVGSREPHEFTNQWMQTELYQFLKKHRLSVISGGARGIDQKAHLISMLLEIPTVVILPTGLFYKYPVLWNEERWNTKPVVFISEMRLSEKISKRNFSPRNRLIAAWGLVTLIVEAHQKSGTLMTAHHALAEGRPLWIVPGHPQMPSFAGSLELTIDHGQIVRNASDLSMLFEAELSHYASRPLGLVYS
jgi:DNA processing protein